ncbi:hypothetical protein [Brevibacillus porteri]|uniref:hypothetical protein n=1 Tax=Brevibacillus porteri TaxID=2126350 RepID=UPI00362D96D6
MSTETDKERILANILDCIARSCITMPYAERYKNSDKYGAYLGWFESDDSIKIGDLVMCATIRDTKYKFGYITKIISQTHMEIREIGSNSICSISNERFYPIRGMRKLDLLEGKEYTLFCKVMKAIHKADEYMYRFNDINFESNDVAVVSFRKKWTDLTEFHPLIVKINYDNKTSIKQILEQMYQQGYGTKEF